MHIQKGKRFSLNGNYLNTIAGGLSVDRRDLQPRLFINKMISKRRYPGKIKIYRSFSFHIFQFLLSVSHFEVLPPFSRQMTQTFERYCSGSNRGLLLGYAYRLLFAKSSLSQILQQLGAGKFEFWRPAASIRKGKSLIVRSRKHLL